MLALERSLHAMSIECSDILSNQDNEVCSDNRQKWSENVRCPTVISGSAPPSHPSLPVSLKHDNSLFVASVRIHMYVCMYVHMYVP